MLREIFIKNYTIVDSLTLAIENGLTVLTGETGAGKSIIVDAVNLGLGARADSKAVRHGETRCDITLCFEIQKIPTAVEWLEAHDFLDDVDCIIRRTIHADGRSRSTVNGHPCPQSLMREFGALVLNIHSQHQHQALLKRDAQQQQLDEFGQHQKLLAQLQAAYQAWHDINQALETLSLQNNDREQQLELLRYQAKELKELALEEDEWHLLHEEQQKLHHAKELMQNLNSAIDHCAENENIAASHTLEKALTSLKAIKNADPQIETAHELLTTAAIHLQEAAEGLQQYRSELDLSPERLAIVEARLTQIHDMARKHHTKPDNLAKILNSLEDKISSLEHLDEKLAELKLQQSAFLADYENIAATLSGKRKSAAEKLSELTTQQIQKLGMKGGEFKIHLEPNTQTPHPQGNEKVQFHVSTNPGQPLQVMSKIVSGGELSRISLAIQVECSQKENVPTIIFDEVDTGIGGQTAEVVGQLLRKLGSQSQLLCITHLAQVASQGHHQFKVEKQSKGDTTATSIKPLTPEQRINEIARMLSGSKISEQSLKHAQEMLV